MDQPQPHPWHHRYPGHETHAPKPLEELVGGKRLCEVCDTELATDDHGNPVTPDKATDR